MDFLAEYGVFLAKAVTIVIAILIIIAGATSAANKNKGGDKKHLKVTHLNEKLKDVSETLDEFLLDKEKLKEKHKSQKKADKKEKADHKKHLVKDKPNVFVIQFVGDIKASAVENLRDEVTAILSKADPATDEVVVVLESAGGMVHSYGLASAQLDRIRKKGIKLTACVDKVAASGGYMMACVADRIIASPFAVMGSIGVVAQLPNFHKVLQKNDIDLELHTAGEHKRTLTMFGENTDKAREKFKEDLEDTHMLFKDYVKTRRSKVDIDEVANGDIWFGQRALDVNLVDELMTSDEYLVSVCEKAEVFKIEYKEKHNIMDKLNQNVGKGIEKATYRILNDLKTSRFLS